MMQNNLAWSRETETSETTPLLSSERNNNSCHPEKGVGLHSPNPSISSQLESSPSSSRSPICRRPFSAGSILSSDTEEQNEASSLSLNLQCKCSKKGNQRNFFSRSEPFCDVLKWVQLRLENSGSVARDHLASERTFLAYMRTSLAIASSGVGGSLLYFN